MSKISVVTAASKYGRARKMIIGLIIKAGIARAVCVIGEEFGQIKATSQFK